MTNIVSQQITDRDLCIKSGMALITPRQAKIIVDQHRFPGQDRDLSFTGRAHTASLAQSMSEGKWMPGDKLPFALLDGKLYALDGHHRLSSQVVSGVSLVWSVVIYACVSTEEMNALYSVIDSESWLRTPTQKMKAIGIHKTLGLSSSVTATLRACAPFVLSGFKFDHQNWDNAAKKKEHVRQEFMRAYSLEARTWVEACENAPLQLRRALQTQGAFSVALVAFKHQPAAAIDFWHGMSNNDGLGRGDPRHAYITSILAGNAKQTIEYKARQIAIAWNAHFLKRPLSLIRVANATPFSIAGTPYA